MSSFDQSEQQQLFRHILAAMSYPGRVQTVDDSGGVTGSAHDLLRGVIVTLVDRQVTLADPHSLVADDLWSWLGQSPAPADAAQYIVADPARTPEFSPQVGTLESPEYGATIIMPVTSLEGLDQAQPQPSDTDVLYVSGPSRKNPRVRGFRVSPCHASWLSKRQQWQEEDASFPLGTDWLLVSPDSIVAVPRSCQLLKDCPKERLDP